MKFRYKENMLWVRLSQRLIQGVPVMRLHSIHCCLAIAGLHYMYEKMKELKSIFRTAFTQHQ